MGTCSASSRIVSSVTICKPPDYSARELYKRSAEFLKAFSEV